MRLFRTVLGLLAWRANLARHGVVLRWRSVASALVVLAGVGAAIGYALVGRFLAATEEEDDDQAGTPPDRE